MIPYIFQTDSILLFRMGESPITINTTDPRYNTIVEAIRDCDWGAVEDALDQDITGSLSTSNISVKDGVVLFKGSVVPYELNYYILHLVENSMSLEPIDKFLCLLEDNPSKRIRQRLFEFMSYGKMPITEDGHFLAFKKVRADYRDIHSGTFVNAIGSVVEMSRRDVDDDDNNTCSTGLHVCSHEYLNEFGSTNPNHYRVVMCKINPADVVSIPTDYNNTKMRVCRYEVVSEVNDL